MVSLLSEEKKQSQAKRLSKIILVLKKYNVLRNFTKQVHPEEVCQAFEELGPTFIKIGQMLSVRTDILSISFTRELRKLQNQVKTDTFSEVKQTVETELGQPLAALFAEFTETPMASASIGQAHLATLKTGEKVVVKVQHPGIAEEINSDLSLFAKALPLLRYVPESKVFDLKQILQELRDSLDNELDFTQEATFAEQFYALNNGWKNVVSPKIYRTVSSKKVITLDLMTGESIQALLTRQDDEQLTPDTTVKAQKQALSNLLVEHFMKEVFTDGFFHADPHPGNLLLQLIPKEEQRPEIAKKTADFTLGQTPLHFEAHLPTETYSYRLAFIDFGMMGALSKNLQAKMMNALLALYSKDTKRISHAILALCVQIGPYSEEEFQKELESFLQQYLDLPIQEIDLQKVFAQVFIICHKNNLQIDPGIIMLIKAFGTLEGVIEELTPELSLFEVVAPYAQRYFLDQFNIKDTLKESAMDYYYVAKALPKIPVRTLEAIDTIARGRSKINLELKNQQKLINTVENLVNRVVIGFILSALVIGSSLLIQSGTDNPVINVLGILGYSAAFLCIVLLLFDILHRRFKK